VRDDFRGGIRSGVNGTPTFFINGMRYDGNWADAAEFIQALSEAAAQVHVAVQ
jgi:protein-disulfide isomerase